MKWLWRMADVGWLLALAIFVLAGIDDVPFHGDESTIIFMSRDYHYLVQERDLDPVLYASDSTAWDEQWLRIINGTVSKMAVGIAWDVAGLSVDDLNDQWAWGMGWELNEQYGHVPGERLLQVGRWSSALMLIVSAWAVMGLTWWLTRHVIRRRRFVRLAAWTASAIYITTPVILMNGRRAMFEGAYLCFVMLMMLAAAQLVIEQQSPTKTRRGLILWAMVTGILGGFAIASKHTAVIMVGAVFVALFTEPLVRAPRQTLQTRLRSHQSLRLLRFIVMGLLVVGVFLLLNPAWWSDPLGMPSRVFSARRDLLRGQSNEYGSYSSVGERVEALLENSFWAEPQYYESPNWRTYEDIRAQIATYESRWYAGRGGGIIEGALLIVAFLAGLLLLAEHWRMGSAWLVLVWLVITVLAVLLTTPLNWQRYYDPLSPIVAVIAGTGIGWIGSAVCGRRAVSVDSIIRA